MEQEEFCRWDGLSGLWITDCGRYYVINEGTPEENGMIYCCYCGKKITPTHNMKE